MSYQIQTGSLELASQVDALVPEFSPDKSPTQLAARIGSKPYRVFLALHKNEAVGFLVAYQESTDTFYNWLTGVAPEHRQQGLAGRLIQSFEQWAIEQGGNYATVKSHNRFPSMLRLLIGKGYKVTRYEELGNIDDSKIHFQKRL
ncbi:GNAT family N-acetyltransferase [Paraferrimonas sedimenticola]|uniref:N-acetyltransferase n=1 Tax=Paraferrimonas sedimenticola TaxID=375674 RepID=A0AA37RW63_9GAMM|nr:GNAT family N-acetyltransferase [Paraferrimonas sedimenticola]GLP96153.1 N-acetyltransferase [Paraferrimonas sedimenticola]